MGGGWRCVGRRCASAVRRTTRSSSHTGIDDARHQNPLRSASDWPNLATSRCLRNEGEEEEE
jgi:hypothetical protein